MKIKKEIIDKISVVSNDNLFEIGGILGAANNGIITDMIPDIPQ